MNVTFGRRGVTVLVIALLTLATLPGITTADSRAGGTIIVEQGTTVDGLQAFGGSVIIRGTVSGNVQVLSGSVVIADTGHVTGDVQVAAGSLSIAGTVDGNVEAATGYVDIEPSAVIGGNLQAAAERVTIAGTIHGNVEAGSDTLHLLSSAVVQGDIRYGTDTTLLQDPGATVTGQLVAVDNLTVNTGFGPLPIPTVASWVITVYGALFLILIGALLLAAFPSFTTGVADRVADTPLETAGVGLLGLVGALVVIVALVITIIGIPLAFLAILVFVVAVIAALALGQYAIGAWSLSMVDIDNRWAALVFGVLLVTVVSRVPYVGWIVDVAAFVLGFGAILLGLRTRYRRHQTDGDTAPPGDSGEPPSEPDTP